MDIATEAGRLAETTDKTTESTFKLSDTFQGFGQVASSAFEDAIIKGEQVLRRAERPRRRHSAAADAQHLE